MNEDKEVSASCDGLEEDELTKEVNMINDAACRIARKSFLDLPNLIRSIQRAEGNPDCFQKIGSCAETSCCWRPYCLGPRRIL